MVLGGWGGQVLKDTMGMRRDAKIRRIVGLVLVVLGGFIAAGAFFEPPPLKDGEGLPWETEAKIEENIMEEDESSRKKWGEEEWRAFLSSFSSPFRLDLCL